MNLSFSDSEEDISVSAKYSLSLSELSSAICSLDFSRGSAKYRNHNNCVLLHHGFCGSVDSISLVRLSEASLRIWLGDEIFN